MEAKSERKNGILIFFVNGRLDAFGARQLDELTKGALHDDDKELVLDLSGSTYLSSGGLRTFHLLKNEMKRRDGRFALAGVRDYPKKVLDTAGFFSLCDIFPTHIWFTGSRPCFARSWCRPLHHKGRDRACSWHRSLHHPHLCHIRSFGYRLLF
jgi:anti-anti-sigma factor